MVNRDILNRLEMVIAEIDDDEIKHTLIELAMDIEAQMEIANEAELLINKQFEVI